MKSKEFCVAASAGLRGSRSPGVGDTPEHMSTPVPHHQSQTYNSADTTSAVWATDPCLSPPPWGIYPPYRSPISPSLCQYRGSCAVPRLAQDAASRRGCAGRSRGAGPAGPSRVRPSASGSYLLRSKRGSGGLQV